jgi:hypothetical protein
MVANVLTATRWSEVKRAPVSEMIGRVARPFVATNLYLPTTVDWARADYAFWDQLRRGKKATYEIGALFAKPIARTLSSWKLGKGLTPTVKSSQSTQKALVRFLKDHLITLIETDQDNTGLGDAYLVVNIDGSITRVSPDQVEPIAEPKGSQNIVGYKITTKLEDQTIVDEYRLDGRTVTVTKGNLETVTNYRNLIGMLPVIPWHNEAGPNEVFGHPYYEQCLKLFARYDRTINKALDGVDVMGNPVPVVENSENPDDDLERLSGGHTRSYVDEDGNTQQQYVVDFSRLPIVVLGTGARMSFVGPQPFTEDAGRMLEFLFLLMLQATGIPEWAWGGAIASSKASVDAQMPAFEMLIHLLRLYVTPIILQIMRVWLATISLYTPGIDPQAEIELEYGNIVPEDRAQRLAEVKQAREDGAIRKVTEVRLLNFPGIEDPEAEVAAAEEESAAAQQANQDQVDAALADLLKQNPSDNQDEIPPAKEAQAA